MSKEIRIKTLIIISMILLTAILHADTSNKKNIVYIAADINIPFWKILSEGIKNEAESLGYGSEVYDAQNSPKHELELTVKAIKEKKEGIIISPSTSSACVTVLKLAKSAKIPVVIADVGTDGGEYVSYISSNNKDGAYNIGKILAHRLIELGYQDGKVGIIAIPQKRLNGKERTAGFIKALNESNIKGADIKQLNTWSDGETYNFTKSMIETYPDLRAIWLQTSNMYKGALNAILDANKSNDVLLVTFDAEPEFTDLIEEGVIVGSAMQQPYLMGEESMKVLDKYLHHKSVEKNIQLQILPISKDNIEANLPIIKRNVLGVQEK